MVNYIGFGKSYDITVSKTQNDPVTTTSDCGCDLGPGSPYIVSSSPSTYSTNIDGIVGNRPPNISLDIPTPSIKCICPTPTATPTPTPVCQGNVVSFTSIPNGQGSIDLSSYFAEGAYGSDGGCGCNRVYDLRAYYNGSGVDYIIGGEVTNDGTLVWQPNGGTATLTQNFQFVSNYTYSDYLTLTIRCQDSPVTPPIPPP